MKTAHLCEEHLSKLSISEKCGQKWKFCSEEVTKSFVTLMNRYFQRSIKLRLTCQIC